MFLPVFGTNTRQLDQRVLELSIHEAEWLFSWFIFLMKVIFLLPWAFPNRGGISSGFVTFPFSGLINNYWINKLSNCLHQEILYRIHLRANNWETNDKSDLNETDFVLNNMGCHVKLTRIRKLLMPNTIAALGCASIPTMDPFTPPPPPPVVFSLGLVPSTYSYSGASKSGLVPPEGWGWRIALKGDLSFL